MTENEIRRFIRYRMADQKIPIRTMAQLYGVHRMTLSGWLRGVQHMGLSDAVALLGLLGYDLIVEERGAE